MSCFPSGDLELAINVSFHHSRKHEIARKRRSFLNLRDVSQSYILFRLVFGECQIQKSGYYFVLVPYLVSSRTPQVEPAEFHLRYLVLHKVALIWSRCVPNFTDLRCSSYSLYYTAASCLLSYQSNHFVTLSSSIHFCLNFGRTE